MNLMSEFYSNTNAKKQPNNKLTFKGSFRINKYTVIFIVFEQHYNNIRRVLER